MIREAHPLKQGLKRREGTFLQANETHSRGTSTKTRIETIHKTNKEIEAYKIREAHPLKQGLKLAGAGAGLIVTATIREAHPLKQGLKLRLYQLLQPVA